MWWLRAVLSLGAGGWLWLGGGAAPQAAAPAPAATVHVPPATLLAPGSDDAAITKLTVRILNKSHYLRPPLDDAAASRFLDQYLDALDPLHLIFFEADLASFDAYRATLADLTKQGDTAPAYVIFKRFLQRFDQQMAYVMASLQTNQFAFTSHDRYLVNRKTQPRPHTVAEAHQLWNARLRFEYLQEKLIGSARLRVEFPQEKLNRQKPEENVNTITQKPEEIVKTITRRYTRMQRFLHEYESNDVLQVYLTALTHSFDPHSEYWGRADMENFAIGMKLSLFGIGAQLRAEDGYCKILELIPGGPAARSQKLKPNDRIVAVAQGDQELVDVVDMKLNKVVELIRGPKGTVVRLTIIPADAADSSVRRTVTLVRDEVRLEEQEAKARIIEWPNQRSNQPPVLIGVIDLPSFYAEIASETRTNNLKSTTADVTRLLRKLRREHIAGLILDLRRNGGGSLEEAINLTGLFIPEGPVVQAKSYLGDVTIEEDPDPTLVYGGPLVVLTSRFSASASEILAGALQDYDRALIVGDSSTHGKGTVQQLLQLSPILRQLGQATAENPGALKITIRKFYRPNGASTQRRGVVPDLILPSLNEGDGVGEKALPNALEWDTIAPATFTPLQRIQPVLAELRRRAAARQATNSDFIYLRSVVDRFKASQAEKTVSLNETQRLEEKDAAAARQKARTRELRQRPDSGQKTYEITLKLVDQPGLPPPLSPTNTLTAAARPADPDQPEIKPEEEEAPPVDIPLAEAEYLLLDLLRLSGKAPAEKAAAPPLAAPGLARQESAIPIYRPGAGGSMGHQ